MPAVRGYTGTQLFYTYPGKDPTEPNACGVVGGASYWFTYVPPEEGIVSLNTDGSRFDTVLGVYADDGRGLGYASLISVACDNNSGANGRTSSLKYSGVPGTANYIMVDGVNGAYGITYLNYKLDPLPRISSIPSQTIYEDQSTPPISFTISDASTPADSLRLAGGSSDTNLVPTSNILFGGSGSNRTVTVTPTLYRHGTNTLSITVTNAAGGTRSTAFTLNVIQINHRPVAGNDTIATYANTLIYVPVSALLANDTDVDGDRLTLTAVASPSANTGRVSMMKSAMVLYTPPLNSTDPDQFFYTISDGMGGTATATVFVTFILGQTQ
jgi:hypothetical protein